MKLALISVFPEMLSALTDYGITRRAIEKQLVSVKCWNPRDFTTDKHQTVDDRPYGGGPGMLMKPEPLIKAITEAKQWAGNNAQVIYLSPQGRPLDQPAVEAMAGLGKYAVTEKDEVTDNGATKNLILLAGRYEGIDERVISQWVDSEYSIGDYIISGGELAAMVLMDAVIRLLPGALGHEQSASEDSFSGDLNHLLDCPHYTRPEVHSGESVPEVLLSGDHQRIARWRLQQSLGRTSERRPELLAKRLLTVEEQKLLDDYLNGHKA